MQAQADNWDARPFTPWVGRRDNKVPVESFVKSARVKKITRVGLDVKASCGMFVQ